MPVTTDQQRVEKRSRIVEAAVQIFAEKGFRQARVSDIARRAGVADGTIYLYFKNKEDLLLVIFEEKMEVLVDELRQALQGISDPLQRLRVYAENHFHAVQEHPALAQVLQVELRQSHRFIREYRPEKLWDYLGVFAELVREGQAAGAIRDDVDPFLAQWAFFGALDEISIQWVLARKRGRFNLDQAAAQVVDMFLHGMATPGSLHPAGGDPAGHPDTQDHPSPSDPSEARRHQ
ncbi:MAG: TetR/AcrR family transcriptional regulator [Alphaproteobacteria bacterium]|nr:TetR/AcrR family transcriptional regulator [Alphaproteobacteria bacterium]